MASLLIVALGASAQNTIDKKGLKQGHWLKTDKGGAKIYEGTFKDGMETGTFEYYYPNGKVRMRNVFIVDGKLCSHEAFDEQGHLLAKGFYNNHNRDSVWHMYNEEGKLIKIASYKMGIKEGQHVVFTAKGDTAEVTNWKDNRRDGRWWKLIGNKSYITANYVKGNIEGKLVEYDENGKLARQGFYKNGNRHGEFDYYEDGVLMVKENWEDGLMVNRKVLMMVPDAQFISVFDIAYLVPKGQKKVMVYMLDGSTMTDNQSADDLYRRIGNNVLSLANKKARVMVAPSCLKGLTKDEEGRDILDVEPKPDFVIFPDEDCLKMLHSHQRDLMDPTESFEK